MPIHKTVCIAWNERSTTPLRIVQKSYARYKKLGYKGMMERLDSEYYRIYSDRRKREEKEFSFQKNSLFGDILHDPLVSLIAVNYNGSKDMPKFLESISKQSYKNYELIIVDNNSTDHSQKIVKQYKHLFNKIVFLQSGENLGFAAGNNYALPYCNGELLCLINVDTVADSEWLKESVDAISLDGSCAAVASKTLFFERFQNIKIEFTSDFKLNLNVLVQSLTYKKYFVRHGKKDKNYVISMNKFIILSLPVQDDKICLSLLKDIADCNHVLYIIGKNRTFTLPFDNYTLDMQVDFSHDAVVNSTYIINNAGSYMKNNMPADRGFGEYDTGQYDSKCHVDFFCGVSVLLRRSAIVNRKIFVSEFFAYYEDSELSRWIRKNGYKILYAPRSVLYHQHSASSRANSPLWNLLVTRSRNIYQYAGDYDELFNMNTKLEEFFSRDINALLYKKLTEFSQNLIDRLKVNNNVVEMLKPIAIYNSYWTTKGGGESHALSFARVLQKYETVYLVSETNFDLDELSEYYHIDLSNCRKIIEPNINESFTQKFHTFINSTYRSNLNSKAKNSYYIVSFPHSDINRSILSSYTFLYNSDYTKRWAQKYWNKNHKGELIYPLGMLEEDQIVKNKLFVKEKIILSVGRFCVNGHTKNQDKIVESFLRLHLEEEHIKDWKLVLVGSLNINNVDDVAYVSSLKEKLQGLNYELIVNSKKSVLNTLYSKSYLYIHATGMEKDINKEPENFEHFGITPIEAAIRGCHLLVYKEGGPGELLRRLNTGNIFSNANELDTKVQKVILGYDGIASSTQDVVHNFIKENNFKTKIKKHLRN